MSDENISLLANCAYAAIAGLCVGVILATLWSNL
jgi:hypothetical protein